MTTSTIIKKTLKWASVAVLFVVVLELCARLDDLLTWGAPFTANYTSEILRVADQYGFHNRPNAKFQKWQINAFGFRGPEITKEKPAGVTRVIIVGASETFGLHESENMEFPAQMQIILDSLYPGQFEVVNAACVGMTPPRIRHYFESWLEQFQPDVVMYYPSPAFYLDNDVPPDSADWEKLSAWRPAHEWRLVGKAKIVLKSFIPMSWQIPLQKLEMDRLRKNHPKDWVFQHIPSDRIVTFHRHLKELVGVVEAAGTRFILSTHVSRFGDSLTTVDERHLLGANRFYPRASEQALLEVDSAANQAVREVAQEMDVPLVEMTDHVPPKGEYFADASHFTDEGARLTAKAFVDVLLNVVRRHGTAIVDQ